EVRFVVTLSRSRANKSRASSSRRSPPSVRTTFAANTRGAGAFAGARGSDRAAAGDGVVVFARARALAAGSDPRVSLVGGVGFAVRASRRGPFPALVANAP